MASLMQGAAELQQLFERFAALSATALRAIEAGDAASLGAALDARALLAPRTAELSRALGEARHAATTRMMRDAIDTTLRPVRAAAAEAERLNDELARQAQSARRHIGEQLDRLRHDDAARTAYAAVAGGVGGAGGAGGAGHRRVDRTR